MAKIDLDALGTEELVALRERLGEKLNEKVAQRQAELEAELARLSQYKPGKKVPAAPAKSRKKDEPLQASDEPAAPKPDAEAA